MNKYDDVRLDVKELLKAQEPNPSAYEQNSASDEQHLNAWQDSRNVYLLFHCQYDLALHAPVRPFIKYIPKGGSLYKDGCGIAPIAASLCKFYPYRSLRITCAGIPMVVVHFVRWKFRNTRYIRYVQIDPTDDQPLDEKYDAIFCMTVLEHLPRPLPVVRHLYSQIKPGGYFIFDYIRSEGKGLDTSISLRDRLTVLQYIENNFKVVKGQIPLDGSHVGTVVCRKI